MPVNFDLHRLGWQAFQDLCIAVAEETLQRPIQTFLPTSDAGRDGAFVGRWTTGDNAGESVIQCKFTSKPDLNLTLSMLKEELPKAKLLANKGLASDYIILTNHTITGQSELAIRSAFEAEGVGRCRVFHRDWIVNRINSSPRLRMMVPRVYGLADLGAILGDDLRAYKQAQLILSEMGDSLSRFVVTDAHRKSVAALNNHGVVLLLGEPAAGKSTIGASLALAAADQWKCSVVKATSAEKLEPRIDPEARQFFWIDDAFGSTQYRGDRTESWNQLFPLMQAALGRGSKFLITSRDYIWRPASRELKISAFPALKNSQVVIYTQNLTRDEKVRILYNHVKLGDQDAYFKRALKPFLTRIADRADFLPETARRLGMRAFTSGLSPDEYSVSSFFKSPKLFLEQTIGGLNSDGKAAIGLLFLNGGIVRSPVPNERVEWPADAFGATIAATKDQLAAMDGSLLLLAQDEDGPYWSYRHPTVTDAFASFVSKDPELVALYLRGAKPESMVSEVVCAGVYIQGAVVTVPSELTDVLVERIGSLPSNTLKAFISHRANKHVASKLIVLRPDVLGALNNPLESPIKEDPDVDFVLSLRRFGLLSEDQRRSFFDKVLEAVVEEADPSFIDRPEIGEVFTAEERNELLELVRNEVLTSISSYIEQIKDRWDNDYDPDEYFEPFLASVATFASATGVDPDLAVTKALNPVSEAIDELKILYHERSSDDFEAAPSETIPTCSDDPFRDIDE